MEVRNMELSPEIKIFMNYRRLRSIQRCNNFLKLSPEDVAQHSFYTAILTMIISDELAKDMPGFDKGLALKKALLHDVAEAITGDIPHNVKEYGDKLGLNISRLLDVIAEEYFKDIGVSPNFKGYSDLASSFKEGSEGLVVGLADILELTIYTYEEVSMGNTHMKGLMEKCIELTEAQPIYLRSLFAQQVIIGIKEGTLDNFQFL
jgi:putative hydrolase of HD superfamily